MSNNPLTAERLRELLRYDPETGKLIRRPQPRSNFWSSKMWQNWNADHANRPILLHSLPSGVLAFSLAGQAYPAARAIWCMVHGAYPNGDIVYRDDNKKNLRLKNLRVLTRGQRQLAQSEKLSSRNPTGFTGVSLQKGRYRARLGSTDLGFFKTAEAASRAREKARKAMLAKL